MTFFKNMFDKIRRTNIDVQLLNIDFDVDDVDDVDDVEDNPPSEVSDTLDDTLLSMTDSDDGHSVVTFTFDKDLLLTINTKVNSKLSVEALIDSQFLDAKDSEDIAAINLALILMANEATEQIIEGINNEAEIM